MFVAQLPFLCFLQITECETELKKKEKVSLCVILVIIFAPYTMMVWNTRNYSPAMLTNQT